MSADYEPGTVAVATVRGVKGVRVMRYGPKNAGWFTPEYAGDIYGNEPQWRLHSDHDVTDIRPLVVLDASALRGKMVAAPSADELPRWLRTLADHNSNGKDTLGSQAARLLADQIEAQTKPARIPEPGLWGVVEAKREASDSYTRRFVRKYDKGNSGYDWQSLHIMDDPQSLRWSDLIDPTLIREGVTQ